MIYGQLVYTVNNKTHKVDKWRYAGSLPTPDGILIHLVRGKKYMFLPKKCVFETITEAEKVAKL